MSEYNYYEAVCRDVMTWIDENINLKAWAWNREGLEEKLNDDLWVEDNVTGNASGSYTFSIWKAEEYLAHNWDLLRDCMEEFGPFDAIEKGAEFCDVSIRCYILSDCISRVLDDLKDKLEPADDEEEEG